MEFNQKLVELRKQRGLTQEQLADELFVSRTAISKWESGRGYPSIDSLKAIASFFSVTVDELLSGDEMINIAENDLNRNRHRIADLLFGLLDCFVILLLFLPLFRQNVEGYVQAVSVLSLCEINFYVKLIYFTTIAFTLINGVVILSLQILNSSIWNMMKYKISITLNFVSVLIFIISMQPYAAIMLFAFLIIKVLMLIKLK